MSAVPRLLTYDDLCSMPEDGARREIVGGDLLVNPAPRFEHQIVVANIHERFGVLEYWIVDPAGHAVSVFSLNPDGKGLELVQTSGHVRSRVFPDLVMLPDEVFRDL